MSESQSMFLFIKAGNSLWTCSIISSVKRLILVRCSNQRDDDQVRVSTPFPIKQTQTLAVIIWEYAPDYMFTKSVMPWLNETSRKRFVDINRTHVSYKTFLKNKDFDLHKLSHPADSIQMRNSNSVVSLPISVELTHNTKCTRLQELSKN